MEEKKYVDEEGVYSIPLTDIIKEFSLDGIYQPSEPEKRLVSYTGVNRPGLQFADFYDHYERERLQIIGRVEYLYLQQQSAETRNRALERFFASKPVGVIITRAQEAWEEMTVFAKKYDVPLLATSERTSAFMAALIAFLNVKLAPRVTRHGVLIEVYGEGILLLGDSGVGKSETAIELVKRGHRLVADDAVEIKRVSSKTLVGEAPEIIRHYVELRGIGIVDVRRLFGMGAVKLSEKIDLIINLEPWVQGKMYDRLGLDKQVTEILGIKIPSITIPVRPGRNLAIILEIAAMNHRQKKMGYNTAEEFNKRLMDQMGIQME